MWDQRYWDKPSFFSFVFDIAQIFNNTKNTAGLRCDAGIPSVQH